VRQDQVTHMHRLSEYQKHSVKRKESTKLYYMTECLNLTIVRVANIGNETHVEVLQRQLTGERAPRTHQTLQGNPQSVHLSNSRVV
jgi:isopentenyl diphosphate isomerase/L-lactate dehydrogenase-like FMN-dependent dehydrogenase